MNYITKEILDEYKVYLKSNNGVSLQYYLKYEKHISGELKVKREVVEDTPSFELLLRGLMLTVPGTFYVISEYNEVCNLIPKESVDGNISIYGKQLTGRMKEFRVNLDAKITKILC